MVLVLSWWISLKGQVLFFSPCAMLFSDCKKRNIHLYPLMIMITFWAHLWKLMQTIKLRAKQMHKIHSVVTLHLSIITFAHLLVSKQDWRVPLLQQHKCFVVLWFMHITLTSINALMLSPYTLDSVNNTPPKHLNTPRRRRRCVCAERTIYLITLSLS